MEKTFEQENYEAYDGLVSVMTEAQYKIIVDAGENLSTYQMTQLADIIVAWITKNDL